MLLSILKPAGTLLPRLALNSNQMKSIFLLSGSGGSRTRKNLIPIRLSVRWFFIRATLLASSPQCLPIPPRTRCFKTAARFATGGVTVKSKFVFTSEKTVGAAGLEPAISFCLTPEKACTPSNFSGQKRLPIPPRPLFLTRAGVCITARSLTVHSIGFVPIFQRHKISNRISLSFRRAFAQRPLVNLMKSDNLKNRATTPPDSLAALLLTALHRFIHLHHFFRVLNPHKLG